MSLAMNRVAAYTKLVLVLIVALAVGTVLVKNRDNKVAFWFFGVTDPSAPINVVWLLLWTAAGSVLCWWTTWKAVGLVREFRDLRRQRQLEEREAAQQKMAHRLAEQEKRIDEKIGGALEHGGDAEDD